MGGVVDVAVDVRIISASRRDLSQAIADKTLLEDLYYRLSVVTLIVPSLRERREDIAPLVKYFAQLSAEQFVKPVPKFGDDLLNAMRAYCVALSAAITVIVASWLGLPVSSTHIAVGAVFGVGFYREYEVKRRTQKMAKLAQSGRLAPEERKRRKLVRRSHFMTIIAAWVITVPAAALLSAVIFLVLNVIFV